MTKITIDKAVLDQALEVLESIALAGMSGSGQESEEGMRDWHARQAWKFIGIAARSLDSLREALAQPQPVQEPVVWLPIETAPKDSSMLRLLVNFDDHSLEDCSEPCWTIGTNALSDTGVDEWLFAGWDWTHDRFTQGTGTPIGWLPMLYTSPQAAQPLTHLQAKALAEKYGNDPLNLIFQTEQAHGITKGQS